MSKNKGSAFERKIAKKMSERWSHHYVDNDGKVLTEAFTRVLHSGAYFGKSNAHRANGREKAKVDYGDIATPESFPYVIECKHYKEAPSLKAITSQKCAQWDKWIKQVEQDAETSGKSPMLIAKYNLIPEMVFVKKILMRNKPIFRYRDYSVYTLDEIISGEFFNLNCLSLEFSDVD